MDHAPHIKLCACGSAMAVHGIFRVCQHCDAGCTKDRCVRCAAYLAGVAKRASV